MKDMGVLVEKHHHEVAPSQHELGVLFNTLVTNADNMQIYKYAVHQVANSFGKTATFMPKPVKGDNGSGMHTHQSIWKDGKPLFAGDGYAGLSDMCLHYIGGIIKHAKAINAFSNSMNKTGFEIDSNEGPYNTDKKYENGNLGHRPGIKGGYFPVPPVDSAQDLRAECLKAMKDMGVLVEKHHHEVAPSQHELGVLFNTLVTNADNMQIYKYAVHQVANSFGKTATFMPKPVKGDNGSGMHTHQSIWKDGKPLFAGDGYAGLSEMCLHYIGGIIKHAKAINAFSNSTTNSYKRLIPGFEAPVLLAYSSRNRSASCRIPFSSNPKGKRVEVRFPDAAGNPYLTFAAMLMAGLDGIKNKIDPGKPFDKDLYALSEEELKGVPTVCGSLREAVISLDADREFLKAGGVFSDDQIDAYIDLKMEEIHNFEHTPHPIEFQMYYSC
jgi:glutamine synthetase